MRSIPEHYADALADVALSQQSAGKVRQELADFLALLHESPQLTIILESPAVSRKNKQAVVDALVSRMGASQTLRNFLSVVLDHRRTVFLSRIQAAFDSRVNQLQGVTRANISSVRELNAAEKAELNTALERLTRRRIEAQYMLDPSIIAGAVVRIGSTIYDGSVRSQLERLRARLASQ